MPRRVVDTNFWTDMQVMDQYSIEDKYFCLYLLTSGKSTQLGIYGLPKKMMSFETGFTSEVIEVLLERFSETYGKIIYSEKTQEITYLRSLEFSILGGGKPVKDLLEKELTQVKDDELIQVTYEAMLDFWKKSKRKIDHTIQELFEIELTSRGLYHLQNQKQKQSINHKHNQNQESGDESESTTRGSIREKVKNEDEDAIVERYAAYLNSLKPELKIELTKENIMTTFYSELIGEVLPHVMTTLNKWQRHYPITFILEALKRSVEATHPIAYANTILENWKSQDITNYQDILLFDKKHNNKKIIKI